ncbi:MAG: ISNCY family transposase [Candidatus Micrarchaeota archaeon]|nr:ISNCY family transposase [Candidatus Micrarchaeota archaeon]
MRKVVLRVNEQHKYDIIKKLVETNGSKERAAIKIGCTVRQVNRLIAGYKKSGKEFFIHGNRGRKPVHTLDSNTKKLIVDLYRNTFFDANFTHFSELLLSEKNIKVSPTTIRNILSAEFILSPKAKKVTRKNMIKHLKVLQKQITSKKEKVVLQSAILATEDSHPRRPRCKYAGEMIQMDASPFLWFGNIVSHLHIAVDDASGNLVGVYFDKQETLHGYYTILNQILSKHGIPYMLFTDNRTVFEYKRKIASPVENDTMTQFAYACKQLGIELQTSSVPQAKGRVERMFQTLQSRIPVLLRLAGITTIEAANEFLNSYIKEFNKQFALPLNHIKSVFEKQPSNEKINLILAVLATRKIDSGHCIKFENNFYLPVNSHGQPVCYRKSTPAVVIKAFDGRMFTCINDVVYSLNIISSHQDISKNIDTLDNPQDSKKIWIPPTTHPWRFTSFMAYIETLKNPA